MIAKHRIYDVVITAPNGVAFKLQHDEEILDNEPEIRLDSGDEEIAENLSEREMQILFDLFDIKLTSTETILDIDATEDRHYLVETILPTSPVPTEEEEELKDHSKCEDWMIIEYTIGNCVHSKTNDGWSNEDLIEDGTAKSDNISVICDDCKVEETYSRTNLPPWLQAIFDKGFE